MFKEQQLKKGVMSRKLKKGVMSRMRVTKYSLAIFSFVFIFLPIEAKVSVG